MKYVALLRGVNVGGKSLIKMVELQEAVEKAGFQNVKTVIQSGNIIFESAEKNAAKIETILERTLKEDFKLDSRIVVKSHEQLKKVLTDVPPDWKTRDDIRCYIAFAIAPVTAPEVINETQPKEGIDLLKAGDGVVYMTTLLSSRTKSGFTKIIGRPIYKKISLRNYKTVKKVLQLMES